MSKWVHECKLMTIIFRETERTDITLRDKIKLHIIHQSTSDPFPEVTAMHQRCTGSKRCNITSFIKLSTYIISI